MCFVAVFPSGLAVMTLFSLVHSCLVSKPTDSFLSQSSAQRALGKSYLMFIRYLFLLHQGRIFLADLFPIPRKYSAARADMFFPPAKIMFSCMRMFSQSKIHLTMFLGPVRLSMLCMVVFEQLSTFNPVG